MNKKSIFSKIMTIIIIAGILFFLILYVMTIITGSSLCPVKYFFNISCFGCGLTRGFICILHMDYLSAIKYNVLSIPLFIGIFLYLLFFVIDILFDKNLIGNIEVILLKKYMHCVYSVILMISVVLNNI